MKYLFIIIFAVAVAVHLQASSERNSRLRNITKPFIIPGLIGFYCFSVDKISPAVLLALVFSWIGDLLLMIKGIRWFAAGGVSFGLSHFFFVLSYLSQTDFQQTSPVIMILMSLLFFLAASVIFHYLKPHLPKGLKYPIYVYLLVNGAMNCFAIFRALCMSSVAGFLTVIGAVMFFVSDCSLFFVRFKKDSRIRTHFLIMLTYSIGELLIIIGLIMK